MRTPGFDRPLYILDRPRAIGLLVPAAVVDNTIADLLPYLEARAGVENEINALRPGHQ